MTAKAHLTRLLLIGSATIVALSAFTGAASGRSEAVRFIAGNARVVQGNDAMLAVSVSPNGARCSLAVRYKSGAKQKGLPRVVAQGGQASWTWKVPRLVQPGVAHATATCSGAGRATKSFTVIGQIIPPKIQMVKSGWSVRNYPYAGSGVSYGVILANESKSRDATDVKVLVNFVMADNRLIGSASTHINAMAAGSEHALGGELTFPGSAPIARLEVVVEVGGSGPPTRTKPGLSAVRVMPSVYEPAWWGSVAGELQNASATKTVQSVELSAVVLDGAGNIIGGGSGFSFGTLPPAARMFFKIDQGMRPIPLSKAASALVSVVPTYQP